VTPTEAAAGLQPSRSANYVVPFAVFLTFLFAAPYVQAPAAEKSLVWVAVLAPVCLISWPRSLPVKPLFPLQSIAIGAAVFLAWIGPDLIWHGYRDLALFSNPITGHIHSSIPANSLSDSWFLCWRTVRAVVIVPIVEELFWRAWLMRWLIYKDFERVPLGTYSAFAFWLTAILFASEHGPYWDVGLIAGVVYNAWMVRTKSAADCILMHAITNGLLCAYVIGTGQWQYWL
jgi:CAAX prenyl protease-like protein